MHHLMVELFSLDDVGQCYDIAHDARKTASASRSAATPTIS